MSRFPHVTDDHSDSLWIPVPMLDGDALGVARSCATGAERDTAHSHPIAAEEIRMYNVVIPTAARLRDPPASLGAPEDMPLPPRRRRGAGTPRRVRRDPLA